MVLWRETIHVKNRIEWCLFHYMDREEVVQTLLSQDGIHPVLTATIWERLERENPDFFKAYYMTLQVKRQTMSFNQLLELHIHLMKTLVPPNLPMTSLQNVIHSMPASNLSEGYPLLQQPPMPAIVEPHLGFVGHEASNYYEAKQVHAPPSCAHCMNYGTNKRGIPAWNGMSSNLAMSLSPECGALSNWFLPSTSSTDATFLDSTLTSETISGGGVSSLGDSPSSPGQLFNCKASDLKEDITQSGDFGALGDETDSQLLPQASCSSPELEHTNLASVGINIGSPLLPYDLEALINSPQPEYMDFGPLKHTANPPSLQLDCEELFDFTKLEKEDLGTHGDNADSPCPLFDIVEMFNPSPSEDTEAGDDEPM